MMKFKIVSDCHWYFFFSFVKITEVGITDSLLCTHVLQLLLRELVLCVRMC